MYCILYLKQGLFVVPTSKDLMQNYMDMRRKKKL